MVVVRIAMILTQFWIPGQNPRVPYVCYLVCSLLSPFSVPLPASVLTSCPVTLPSP